MSYHRSANIRWRKSSLTQFEPALFPTEATAADTLDTLCQGPAEETPALFFYADPIPGGGGGGGGRGDRGGGGGDGKRVFMTKRW